MYRPIVLRIRRRNPSSISSFVMPVELAAVGIGGLFLLAKVAGINPAQAVVDAVKKVPDAVGQAVAGAQQANNAAIEEAHPGFGALCELGQSAYAAGQANGMSNDDAMAYAQSVCGGSFAAEPIGGFLQEGVSGFA